MARRLTSCGLGSVVAMQKLSCPMACGGSVSPPEIEPTSPALEGRLPITGPPGKPLIFFFLAF